MLCTNCKIELPAGTKFCTNCGIKQEAASGGKKRNKPFVIAIVILSTATLIGEIITLTVFDYFYLYNKTESHNMKVEQIIGALEYNIYSHYRTYTIHNYNDRAYYFRFISPWKHPLDKAAVITRVYYRDKNSYLNYTAPLQADKITYLWFDFMLTGDIPTGDNLSIKIIRTSTGVDECEGRHTVAVTEKKEYSTSWGSDSGGSYERGWYLIQIVHNKAVDDKKVIGQQYVYIQ